MAQQRDGASTQTPSGRPERRGPYRKTAARRQEILDSALAVFGKSGYAGGSLRDIADAVGISQAGLLHHFQSKSELLTAVLERRDEDQLSMFERPLGINTLVTVLDVVEFNVAHRGTTELHCVLSAEATHVEHPAHRYFADRYAYLNRLLTKAFERVGQAGHLRAGVTARSASHCTFALMDGLQVQWLLDPTSVDMVGEMERYLRQLVKAEAWRGALASRTRSAS
jgi:AcrR family transcriptional regulator